MPIVTRSKDEIKVEFTDDDVQQEQQDHLLGRCGMWCNYCYREAIEESRHLKPDDSNSNQSS